MSAGKVEIRASTGKGVESGRVPKNHQTKKGQGMP